jgi:RHS repeat-associated protein
MLLAGDGAFRATPLSARQGTPADTPVAGRAVTLLPDGRRLLTGGTSADGALSTLVIEDPVSGTSHTLDVHLAAARAWHSATVLSDGTVLIFGGEVGGRVVTVAERFDPATGALTSIASTAPMARAGQTATLLSDGRVLLIGGTTSEGVIAATEAWNVTTGEVEQGLGDLNHPRRNHSATLTQDGDVWVSGGTTETGARVSDGELFLSRAGQFIATTAPAAAPAPFVSGALPADNTGDIPESILGSVRFSVPVDGRSVSRDSLTLTGPDGRVPLTTVVSAEGGRLAFLTPQARLRPASEYTLSVIGVVGIDGQMVPPATFRWWTRGADNTRTATATAAEPIARDAAGRPHSPFQDLPPLQAPAGETALSGQALRLNGQPLADVKFEIDGHVAYSDARGQFLLRLDQKGTQHHELVIDGATATAGGRTYGFYEVGVSIDGGRTNILPYTVWMTPLDTAHAVAIPSPTTTEVVVTTPRIPGLEVHIPPGAVIRDHNGAVVRELSITPIPIEQPPFPTPPDLEVPVYFTIQPGGAYIYTSGINVAPGVRLIYPNGLHFPNGQRLAFWRYDADGKGWFVYGQGTVTGTQVVPDQGIAIYEFTAAMVANINFGPMIGPAPNGEHDGDPVDLSTGLFVLRTTDLSIGDVVPIELTRTYRQNDSRIRAFGVGTSHDYDMFLVGATNPWTFVELILADGARLRYDRISAGSSFEDAVFEHTTTPGRFYKSTIRYSVGFGVGWDLRLRDGTVYSFPDSEGASTPRRAALVRMRDRNGNDVVLTRDANWNLTQITSKHGRWIRLSYDTLNRITRAEDNIGRFVQYTYDAIGRLETVTDVNNGVTTFTYDAQHRMRTARNPRNITYVTNDYDANGRVTLQTQADGTTYHFGYALDSNGRVIQTDVTNPRTFVRRLTFNASGYVLTDIKAFGTSIAQTTTFERQAGTNLPLTVTDPLNRKTRMTYDGLGNVLTRTRLADTPDAVTTTYTYEPTFSSVKTITDPLSHTTTFDYDPHGNLITVTDANGNRRTAAYDALGRPTLFTDGEGNSTAQSYSGGDVFQIISPVGDAVTRTVDGIGRLTQYERGGGSTTGYEYNPFGEITRVIHPETGDTALAYDATGNLSSVTDARSKVTSYTYDEMNRRATRTDPLLVAETTGHDDNGNLEQFIDRKGQVTTHSYDALDRRSQLTFNDLSTITYTYDAGNRLTQVVDSNAGTITLGWDLLDRLISETTPEGSVSYTYDAAGRRESMTVAGQPVVTYTHDAGNRLTSITRGSDVIGFGYNSADQRTTLTLPNGIVATSTYDTASRLVGLTYAQGSTTLGNLTYTYDADGNRIAVGGTWARTGLPPALASAIYDDANRIASWGGVSFSYDPNGNLTYDGQRTFTWNARDQLSAVTDSVSNAFQYDGLGRRRAKTVGGVTTGFAYDGKTVVQELINGTPSASLLSSLNVDESIARTDTNGTRYFLADALSSTLALTDDVGAVRTSYTYEPFGATTVTGEASANTTRFTGRNEEGQNLYYYRARYYSPRFQRFNSEDPLGFGAGDTNLLAYVSNNPAGFRDPDGTCGPWCVPVVVVVVIGIVAEAVYPTLECVFTTKCHPELGKPHIEEEPYKLEPPGPYEGPRPPPYRGR